MPLTTRKETTASNDIKTVPTTTVTPEKSTNKREIDLGIMYYSYEMKNGLNDSHLEGEDKAEAFLKEYSDVSPKHTFSILKMNGCPTKPSVLKSWLINQNQKITAVPIPSKPTHV